MPHFALCTALFLYFLARSSQNATALAAAILFYAPALFIRHRRILNTYQMVTNIAFLTLLMGTVIFLYFCPFILVESFSVAISVMMLNVALDSRPIRESDFIAFLQPAQKKPK